MNKWEYDRVIKSHENEITKQKLKEQQEEVLKHISNTKELDQKIIQITNEVIISKLSNDGDLREPDPLGNELDTFEVIEGDDLGFYQQACEYLISKVSISLGIIPKFVEDKSLGISPDTNDEEF